MYEHVYEHVYEQSNNYLLRGCKAFWDWGSSLTAANRDRWEILHRCQSRMSQDTRGEVSSEGEDQASASAPSVPSVISSKSFYIHLTYLLSLSNTGVSTCLPLASERYLVTDMKIMTLKPLDISVPFSLYSCHVPSVPSVLLWTCS